MRFRPAIFIWFVFAQSFFKFHKNDDNRTLKPWYFRLRKDNFCRLYNEHARALQKSVKAVKKHSSRVNRPWIQQKPLAVNTLLAGHYGEIQGLGLSSFSNILGLDQDIWVLSILKVENIYSGWWTGQFMLATVTAIEAV